ncbi:5'-methylthioadenosine/S-adenosylhomocysteine nucleosidase [Mycoplasma enhydrae]|uniref:5'-methylthioadenosine/S-adenosylhomocysteine nucleosidase n=1 Tax=Mycoplasma enhydrae TaxID=2499220 RepID=UPI0021E7C30A|nr:5'-methylthioadenosine/S-adenosylhomocysteine nucleosidase [Mycoplasma enhydrae]MCV3733700.1 5'-methylthioadenosine/S-adenosylhomocysteine nucleosidase [Mycoplasma enhydrae]MCV3753643.1 5'-methylthioadenosine/S-adenosylhomocysteine nucleosidase [Mycoplasma enhydrae]
MKLIIFAEEQESVDILKSIKVKKTITLDNDYSKYQELLLCEYKNKEFYVVHCGVGKVNSALFLSWILANEKFEIDYIINIGPAGGLKDSNISQAYLIKNSYYYDVNLTCLPNYSLGQLPNNIKEFKTDFSLNKRINAFLNLDEVNNATADRFSTQSDIEIIDNNFDDIYSVDMEAGALIHTANFYKKPISVIKVISDNLINPSNSDEYKNNTQIVSNKINDIIMKILERLD